MAKRAPADDKQELNAYLSAMGKTPLLTHEQEIACGKAMEAGGKEGEEARKLLIRSNLRLVVVMARKLLRANMSYADAIQDGNIGLIRAVEKYDYRKGFRFSTYASWWVKQGILRAHDTTYRAIRMPAQRLSMLSQIHQAQRFLIAKTGKEPDLKMISELLEMSVEQIESLLIIGQDMLSLDEPMQEDTKSVLLDLVEDTSMPSIIEQLQFFATITEIDEVLANLTPREEKIIRLRYGLREPRPLSLDEIGNRFALTRERIRQIEIKAMTQIKKAWMIKLRHEA